MVCKKCGCRAVLACGRVYSFCPDEEPYENGIIEDSKQDEIEATVLINIYYCEECDKIIDACIESF